MASKGDRLKATIVEGLIYVPCLIGLYAIFDQSYWEYFNEELKLTDILYAGIFSLLIGAVWYPLFSGNLGHRIFKLKVISLESGKDYEKSQEGAIREFLKSILGFLIIPSIWILWDDNNQNLYDKLTKTHVVKCKTN